MSSKLVAAALCRAVFYPLLLLCVSDNPERRAFEVESDLYSLSTNFAFAFTNGILISSSFMHGPQLIAHTTGTQERASELLTFAVYIGLLSGSMLSFPVSQLAAGL